MVLMISTMMVLEFDVTILSPSSIDFEIMAREKKGTAGEIDPLAVEVLRLERDILMQEIRGYGARFVDWKPNVPLTQILMEARNV